MRNNQQQLSFFTTAARLTDMLETLDAIHTAASDNTLEAPNAVGRAELISWLREIAYVANEAAAELDAQPADHPGASFRVIEGRGSRGNGKRSADTPDGLRELDDFTVLVGADAPTSSPMYVLRAGG